MGTTVNNLYDCSTCMLDCLRKKKKKMWNKTWNIEHLKDSNIYDQILITYKLLKIVKQKREFIRHLIRNLKNVNCLKQNYKRRYRLVYFVNFN